MLSERSSWIIAGGVIVAALILAVAIASSRGHLSAQPLGGSTVATASSLARTQVQDEVPQSGLRLALVSAKMMWTTARSYAAADASATGLVTVEPTLCYVAGDIPSSAQGPTCESGAGDISISVQPNGTTAWAAAEMSYSGTCFWIKDDATTGTTFGSGEPCTGSAALGASDTSWASP